MFGVRTVRTPPMACSEDTAPARASLPDYTGIGWNVKGRMTAVGGNCIAMRRSTNGLRARSSAPGSEPLVLIFGKGWLTMTVLASLTYRCREGSADRKGPMDRKDSSTGKETSNERESGIESDNP